MYENMKVLYGKRISSFIIHQTFTERIHCVCRKRKLTQYQTETKTRPWL